MTRTWTPESFLGRINFWLEKTARGELHPADQPVEQLFFTTSNELVLPWNVDALLTENPQQKLTFSRESSARSTALPSCCNCAWRVSSAVRAFPW
ncbi:MULTISPECIES: hypothetical protein [Variovorax]|uniref:hypothetical protein n=1 Tax=Variovorax TaxID=34072 RepID=UPI00344C6DF2